MCFLQNKHLDKPDHSRQNAGLSDLNLEEWVCLCNGLLHTIREALGLETLTEVLAKVQSERLYPASSEALTTAHIALLQAYNEVNGQRPNPNYAVNPPTSVAELLHWRIIVLLLAKLNEAERASVLNSHRPLT